ncbi:MAG TPA: hypothetical protein VFQ61_20810 [Polyangiaceae bacterium]|nr:hypothetical protein [Polyangiaceae bacterium]
MPSIPSVEPLGAPNGSDTFVGAERSAPAGRSPLGTAVLLRQAPPTTTKLVNAHAAGNPMSARQVEAMRRQYSQLADPASMMARTDGSP